MDVKIKWVSFILLVSSLLSSADVVISFPVTDTTTRNLFTLTLNFTVDGSGNVTLDANTSNPGSDPQAVVNAWDGIVGTLTNPAFFNTSFSLAGVSSGTDTRSLATTATIGDGLGIGDSRLVGAGTQTISWAYSGPGVMNFKTFSYANRIPHSDSNLRLTDDDTGTTYMLPNTSTAGTNDISADGFSISDSQAWTVTTDSSLNSAAGASLYGFSFDVIPEPATIGVFVLGGLLLFLRRITCV